MTTRISDLHIAREDALPSPESLHQALPCAEPQAAFIARSREAVRRILRGEDDRLLVIVGPCSIHDPQAAVEYATRLRDAAKQRQDTLLPIMRVYFEKPRTRMGWKGLIYDPDLDGAGDIAKGLRAARGLLLECAAQEVPAASEILDLVTPQYYAELLSWGAIGARTVESPLHRQMASALSAPVGFKNATHGGIDVAIDAIHVAQQAHRFPSISMEGRAIVVSTTGNPDGHLVLRGGSSAPTGSALPPEGAQSPRGGPAVTGGPNHDAASVAKAAHALASAGLTPRLLIDCSHGNSAKDYRRQPQVAAEVAAQVAGGSQAIAGVLLESHLFEGKQEIVNGRQGLVYGQSVTDGCIGWERTVGVLDALAAAVMQRRRALGA
jgi:3-deoxy-7-phosphoheptulonate synthase